MRSNLASTFTVLAVVSLFNLSQGGAATLYSNDAPNGLIGVGSRPGVGGKIEIEAADDFILPVGGTVTGATFTGIITGTSPVMGSLDVEIYRVFPKDSDTGRTPNVVTRTNSPSDVAFDIRISPADLFFTVSTISTSITTQNSVLNGINKSPNQTTGGEGAVSGTEVQFVVTFTNPFTLPADHYFFIPQVQVTGGEFFWLSAARPTSPPFTPDLQAWVRNANLDPDWSRVGTDIVGGAPAPMFNMAFSLQGTTVPEPAAFGLIGLAIGGLILARRKT